MKRNLVTPIVFMIMAAAAVTTGCAEDTFVASQPELTIAAFTEGATYLEVDDENLVINLGEVPVYGSKTATFELYNPTGQTLTIQTLDYVEEDTQGQLWGDVTWRQDADDVIPKLPPLNIPAGAKRLIDIPFAPLEEGEAVGSIKIVSNAKGVDKVVTVLATGVYFGQPDIEIEYNGLTGPTADAEGNFPACTDGICTMPTALDFGNIGLDSEATARITIRNTAMCEPYPGGDACMSCALTINNNESVYNIGLGFKEGSNDDGRFSFAGSTATPFSVPQQDVDCGNSGEIKVLVNFAAPAEESTFSTVVVIESNDPDEPVIEIPINATARNAPIAIGEVRECGGVDANGNAILTDCVYEDEIEPLGRVYFDGSQSYDPSGGSISQYYWEVISAPQGVNPDDYDWAGSNSAVSSFWIPIAGEYTVRLTVWNDSGIQSGVTEQSDVTVNAVPASMLHVQLVWDHPSNDQDLHMTHASANGHFCSTTLDCFFSNKQPVWFSTHAAGEGPNPRLDKDDTNGLGPENVNIDRPTAGTYRVFAHYYPWVSAGAPTVNTVRIYLSGVLRFAEQRTLTSEEQVWAVADIAWFNDGSETGYGDVTPYPSPDGSNQVGEIAIRDSSSCYSAGGWIFPSEM